MGNCMIQFVSALHCAIVDNRPVIILDLQKFDSFWNILSVCH